MMIQSQSVERRRGTALVMAVLLFSGLSVLSYAFFQVVTRAERHLDAGMDDERAFYLAEAGLHEAIEAIRNGGTGAIASEDVPAYFGGGVFWTTSEVLGDDLRRIVVTAMAGGGRQALELVLRVESEEDSLFVATLNSKETITLNEGVVIDSFRSSLGTYSSQAVNSTNGHPHADENGHVKSNADIILNANATVFGDAVPGPSGSVEFNTGSFVSGSVTPAETPFTFPPIETPLFTNSGSLSVAAGPSTSLPPGQYDYDALTIEKGATLNIEGPAEIVVRDFVGGKDGNLVIDATNGPVTIYVEDSYAHQNGFEADAAPGSPMALAFMVSAQQDIVFPSTTAIRGAYYLPEANILFSNANECWGAFAANRIEMANDMKFHFDEDLAGYWDSDTGQGEGEFEILAWSQAPIVSDEVRRDRQDPLARLGVSKEDLPRPFEAWEMAADTGQ